MIASNVGRYGQKFLFQSRQCRSEIMVLSRIPFRVGSVLQGVFILGENRLSRIFFTTGANSGIDVFILFPVASKAWDNCLWTFSGFSIRFRIHSWCLAYSKESAGLRAHRWATISRWCQKTNHHFSTFPSNIFCFDSHLRCSFELRPINSHCTHTVSTMCLGSEGATIYFRLSANLYQFALRNAIRISFFRWSWTK